MAFTYSFSCPFCHKDWEFQEFAVIAKDVFSSFDGVGTCPRCRGTFSWVHPGTLKGKRWYEGRKHYKNGKCRECGKAIDGKRKYCNVACRMKAYRKRKNVTPMGVTET